MSLASAPSRASHTNNRRRRGDKDAASAAGPSPHFQVPERFKLTGQHKKQYATVAELKPDWTEDEILEFCKKCSFNPHVIQEGLANAFEDSRPHKEICANDWNTVDKKPRKPAGAVGAPSARHHDDEGRHNNRRDNNHRDRKNKDKDAASVPAVIATSSKSSVGVSSVEAIPPLEVVAVGDSRVEEGAPAEAIIVNNNLDAIAPATVDNNRKSSRNVGERKMRGFGRKGSAEKSSCEGEDHQRRPKWKKPQKLGEQEVSVSHPPIERVAVQDKYHASKPMMKVLTTPPEVGPKPTYAGLFKRGATSSVSETQTGSVDAVVDENVHDVVESVIHEGVSESAVVDETPEVSVEIGMNVSSASLDAEELVEGLSAPVVSVEHVISADSIDSQPIVAEPVQVSVPLQPESSSSVVLTESARVAIVEGSDAYLPVAKSSATPPTPIGPTPKKTSHVPVPSLKSSASRSVWRVKENQPINNASSTSTVTPPPSPAQDVPKQVIPEVDVSFSDSKLYEQSQEIIKDISSRAIQKVESIASSKEESSLDSSTFEFGFGLTSGPTAPPSFASIPETVVPLPHESEGEQAIDSQVYEEDQESTQLEGFDNELTDDVFGPMESYEFASQPVPGQYAGYRGVPGVLPTSPYIGAIPHPYFMMAYEPDGTPSHAAPMTPNFYDPYRVRAQRGHSRARQGVSKQGSHPSGSSGRPAQSSGSGTTSYRQKSSQRPRGDRRDNRVKDVSEPTSFNDSSIPVQSPQVSKDLRATAGSSSVIGSKRQGPAQRGNYMQAPHQVPGPMMYPYPYAMPYSPQYPVPFPGYVYAGPAGSPYNYMYPGPTSSSQVVGFEDEFSGTGYAEVVPSTDTTGSRSSQAHVHETPRQHPGAYPHQVPLAMFDAAASWQHHPEMLNDPSVAAAAADYSMAHIMNAPGYMDMQSQASNMGSGSSMGYDPREFNGAPASSGSYYRISPFNNAAAGNVNSGSNNNGSSEQSQAHHGLSFQQWNHQSQ
eukprot:TRINITY_DN3830_c0_g1_i1.p1 TRINITY_DN3830_c0_g1~~TRINITY_DN3830_c0_g1_i1.p1  ORF type:complete len:995 (-),score=228.21 TRINITY_DN3830_c0_g1_i1:539-3523(-)